MFGMKIGELHTYWNLGLKMLLPLVISPPVPVTTSVSVPGRDGDLDLSEFFGEIKYKNRTIAAKFNLEESDPNKFSATMSGIFNYLHGKVHRIILDSDKDYYYEGRVTVSCNTEDYLNHEITIAADASPYKKKIDDTIITTSVDGEAEIICPNERKSVIPKIIATAAFLLEFDGKQIAVSAGTTFVPDLKFVSGANRLLCQGTGDITFQYQEESL